MKYETGFRTSEDVLEKINSLQDKYHISRAEVVRRAILELRTRDIPKNRHVQFRLNERLKQMIAELQLEFPELNASEIYELAVSYLYEIKLGR